ncbi:hypothetical protein MAHJHV63_07480 [Mycobacterium avium subsp. hominissuis]
MLTVKRQASLTLARDRCARRAVVNWCWSATANPCSTVCAEPGRHRHLRPITPGRRAPGSRIVSFAVKFAPGVIAEGGKEKLRTEVRMQAAAGQKQGAGARRAGLAGGVQPSQIGVKCRDRHHHPRLEPCCATRHRIEPCD